MNGIGTLFFFCSSSLFGDKNFSSSSLLNACDISSQDVLYFAMWELVIYEDKNHSRDNNQ